MKQVVIYRKKDGCGCGGEALQALETLKKELGFSLRVVELDADGALMKRYMARAPVIVSDGRVVSTGPTNLLLLRKRFQGPGRISGPASAAGATPPRRRPRRRR